MNIINSKHQNTPQSSIEVLAPLPSNFEQFIPWALKESGIPVNIHVIKSFKVPKPTPRKRQTSKTSRSTLTSDCVFETSRESLISETLIPTAIPVLTIYNKKDDLIEIEVKNFPFLSQLITIMAGCLQFHPELHKLSLMGKGVNCAVINKLDELTVYSNITDLCLDGSYVPEGNYFILITLCNLKTLSLSRCSINESVCKKIAEKLQHSSTSLVSLNLSSNRVCDTGILDIGYAIRKNRTLLHLDLSDNQISDIGVASLLNQLTEFPLTPEEILEYKIHKVKCFTEKYYLYCESKKNSSVSSDAIKENLNDNNMEMDAKDTSTSENNIIYDKREIIIKNGQLFNVGNLKLCSLNIAYNNLTNIILPKISCVLKYQKEIIPRFTYTGIMRIVLAGNNMAHCIELDEINEYLKQCIQNNIRKSRSPPKKRPNSARTKFCNNIPRCGLDKKINK